jgi:hypothetical protein
MTFASSSSKRRRPWMAGPVIAMKSVWRVFLALSRERLRRTYPLFVGLIIVTILLALATAAGPLAPFVYPLF